MSFAHLHVHSVYSLLDGYSNLNKLVKRTKEMGMPAIGLTDHGTMFGTIEFYNAALKAGVKPIIGVEAYMASRRMQDRDPQLDKDRFHLLLLAENETGYQNLLKISTVAQLEGFYYKPRVDKDFLAAHSEGLICTTGCMAAEIPQAILEGRYELAKKKFDWYYEVFGPERFFIELQDHDIQELPGMNKGLIELNQRYNVQYIATNDVHYVDQEDHRLQDILLAIQTGCLISDPKRMRMTDPSYHLRSPQEMEALFGHIPGAISNTLAIAERCNLDLGFKGYRLPNFPVPEGYTAETYLRELCQEGARWRYGDAAASEPIQQRLHYELGVINKMGFDAYFLIVWDLCRHAAERGIWYTARGSAAGSLVAYCLKITTVDPLEHGLIFERFLNPGRISMPDIDLDFPDDRRAEMMAYCADKYGHDKVAQIITFGTLKARAAVRDVGRVMDIPLHEVDRVAKLIPAIPGKPITIPEAIAQVADLKKIYENEAQMRELLDTATQLEGVVRNAGTHAAGVVVTDRPIVEYAPLHRPTNESDDLPIKTVTQFEMAIVESMGLLKVDFLGLITLTVMAKCCELIEQRHGKQYRLHNIPIDDPKSFELMGRGENAALFQVEGTGMSRYIIEMKPRNLDNVVAMIALYRPGPLDFIPSYIKRMHGQEPIEYRHPALEPIFRETFGIAVYQEQIMRAAVDIAGYTNSDADDLRKAIAKKIPDKLMKHREKFVGGAVKRGVMPAETANQIFEDWLEFARYGFNKSHAVAYGVLAVQTAYLKAHYPIEFMTANLSAYKANTDRVALYVADCRRMGIEVLPPDVNTSGWDFTIEDREDKPSCIRFGLGAVKNVGHGPVNAIIDARQEGGPFKDLSDFARRVDLRSVGKRALESLIKVGALDSFGARPAMLEAVDRIIAISAGHFKAADVGQMSLFGATTGLVTTITLPKTAAADRKEILSWEKELIGLYVSDHPLTPYLETLNRAVSHYSADLQDANHQDKVRVAGLVSHVRPYTTKSGKPMGFVSLQDLQGNIELILFSRTWEKFRDIIEPDKVLLVEGTVDAQSGDPKILVDNVRTEFTYLDSLDQGPGEPPSPSSSQAEAPPAQNTVPPPRRNSAPPPTGSRIPLASHPRADNMTPPNPTPASHPGPTPPAVTPPLRPTPPAISPQPPFRQIAEPRAMYTTEDNDEWDPSVPMPDFPDWEDDFMVPVQPVAIPAPPPDSQVAEPAPAYLAPPQQENSKTLVNPPAPTLASPPTPAPNFQSLIPNLPTPLPVPTHLLTPRPGEDPNVPRRMVTITLRANHDKLRDALKIQRIYGVLVSYPGVDRFALYLFEGNRSFLIEFPNFTTQISDEMLQRLYEFVPREGVRIEPIIYQ
ncbi:MAG: DNA polymerase III subunit alpha [Anaerolineales bacterium]